MALVQKFTSCLDAALRCVPSASPTRLVLRHARSGRVLTDGSPGGAAITFATRVEADRFRHQWLDEAPGWEAVAAARTAARAAARAA